MSLLIDPLGHDLSVIILCQPRQADAWLSFASWYSIHQNMPDAKVILATERPTSGQEQGICPWAYHLGVTSFFYTSDPVSIAFDRRYVSEPLLLVPAGAVFNGPAPSDLFEWGSGQTLDLSDRVFDVKTVEPEWLVRVKETCGGFVMSKWIDRGGHPFRRTGEYQQGDMTINEKRVLSLWSKLCPIYDSIG